MARIELVIPDADREHFANQAQREGMTPEVWLMSVARQRVAERLPGKRFASLADMDAFFQACRTWEGPEREPDWEERLKVINESRRKGTTDT